MGDDYASVASIEPLIQRHFNGAGPALQQQSHYMYDLFRNKAKKGAINSMGSLTNFKLRGNPNVGAGNARDGFREPGSPDFGALVHYPVGTHITGGIDGDVLSDLENAGREMMKNDVASRVTDDMQMYKVERERNFFHGATGERAVTDVTSGAITYDAATDSSLITLDDEWGVRHINEFGVYQIYSGSTLRGNLNGHTVISKDPSAKTMRVTGDLTAATLGAGALADGDIWVNLGCYNRERDGLPEFLGNSGVYAGGDRDTQFRYRGTQVTNNAQSLSVTVLERCDTINKWIDDVDYDATSRMDITSPLGASQLATLAYANYSITSDRVAKLGFSMVKYKDRTLSICNNCSWKEWYQLTMSSMRTWDRKKLALFQNRAASTIHETRGASGNVMDLWHWVWYEKGQDGCVASRLNLLLYNIGAGASDKGHWN